MCAVFECLGPYLYDVCVSSNRHLQANIVGMLLKALTHNCRS
jgi:hypothetical protein